MAAPADILIVQDNLPAEAVTEGGWDETKIALLLDSPLSPYRVLLQYWRSRASQSAGMVTVSESGSSRSLSDVHKQALEMVKYWEGVIKESEATEETVTERGTTINRIRRL